MNPYDEALIGEWFNDLDGGHHPDCDLLRDLPNATCTCPAGWEPYSVTYGEADEVPSVIEPPKVESSPRVPLDLDAIRADLDVASAGIDGGDLPYHPRALKAMRAAEALLAEVERLTRDNRRARGVIDGLLEANAQLGRDATNLADAACQAEQERIADYLTDMGDGWRDLHDTDGRCDYDTAARLVREVPDAS